MSKHPTPQNRHPQNQAPTVVTQSTQWSGPLPPPEALQKFEQIITGSADRILQMAELEQKHRIERERVALGAEIADTRLAALGWAGASQYWPSVGQLRPCT
jgi:uncharacterized membrane protein